MTCFMYSSQRVCSGRRFQTSLQIYNHYKQKFTSKHNINILTS